MGKPARRCAEQGRISVGDFALYYELTGPANADTVVLAHCFTGDHRYWDPHLRAFQGYRILRFDWRGHGRSESPAGSYTLPQMADDVVALCDTLGIARMHYCGVSLGGQVGQHLALSSPERLQSLILLTTTSEFSEQQLALWRERAAQARKHGMRSIADALLSRWFTDEAIDAQAPGYRYMREQVLDFSPTCFEAVVEAMCGLHTTPRLSGITAPAMVIAAPEDPGAPRAVSERMAALIPACELHWLSPARHLASLEHAARFNSLASAFLARQRDK